MTRHNKICMAMLPVLWAGYAVLPAQANDSLSRHHVALKSSLSSKNVYGTENVSTPAEEPKVYVLEQSLPVFLRQAARRSGYQISLSKRVRGVVKKAVLPADIKKIMPEIAEQYDLKWHFQGKQLHVSIGAEDTNRVIYLGRMDFEDLAKTMAQAGIESNSYELSHVAETNSVMVSGSVPFISNIELLVEAYKKNKSESHTDVKVIRFGNVGN
ncbi:MAG: hypothetical protein AAF412_13645 [Pseudomonadota bacterium]